MLFIVPALGSEPPVSMAISSAEGTASLRATWRARQSEGTTSKPTPEITATPRWRASASRAKLASKTGISPVMSR